MLPLRCTTKPTIQSSHLSFEPLPHSHTVRDQYGRPAKLDVVAQLHGLFFLSGIATGENIIPPELTCYRRNLFQISGSIICPAGPLLVVNNHGESMSIVSHEITVSATESVNGNIIQLIVIPPPATSGQEQAPSAIPIVSLGSEGKNSETVSQQIAWTRLQFRVATANNGRRKALQQHFILHINLISTLADRSRVCTAESATAPIVVRGRCPRNFQDRKEISSSSLRGHNSRHSQKKDSLIPKRPSIAKPATMGLLKRPFQFDTGNFPSSTLISGGSYPQWNQAQQQSGHVAPSTKPFSQLKSSIPAYSIEVQRLHIIQDTPPHQEQIPPNALSQHLYMPMALLSGQFDPNLRPTSPRHTEVPHGPLYQPFEALYGTSISGTNANRLYYPHTPAPLLWSSTEADGPIYGAALHLPPQQPPYQTKHQRQPSQDYNFALEAYVALSSTAQL